MQGVPGTSGATGASGTQDATGAQGSDGAQGDQGDSGAAGAPGAKGDQGDQGIQGAQGEKGVEGAKGPASDKGDAGATGATGTQGATGATGATGPQGAPGPQGPAGKVRAQGADKGSDAASLVNLTAGLWLLTGSATLESISESAQADCKVTVDIPGLKPLIYPIVFAKMAGSEIESFTSVILVAIESAEPAAATASCTGEKTSTEILNLTISAVEIEGSKD